MILEPTGKSSRILLASGLCDPIKELEIKIEYTGQGNLEKAIPLDGEIIPFIVKAVNHHDELVAAVERAISIIEDLPFPSNGAAADFRCLLTKLEVSE